MSEYFFLPIFPQDREFEIYLMISHHVKKVPQDPLLYVTSQLFMTVYFIHTKIHMGELET